MSETVFAADPTRLLIAALVRASVGAAVVAMTMAAGIMASMPAVAGLSPTRFWRDCLKKDFLQIPMMRQNGRFTTLQHLVRS